MKDAGIIGFVPRGEYSDTETYDFLQFVYYGDSTYVAKKETTGNPPAEDNEFWQLLAKGRVLGVSGVKGDKETDYRTGDVNITAEDVGAIPAQNGQAGGDLTVKSGWFPLLNLVRNEYGQNAAIQMTCGSKTQNGILLEAWVPNAESTSPGFQIRDRINNFVFFSCRAIGNVIRSKGFHPLALKNDDASGKNSGCGIQLQNLNKNLMSIQAVQISDDKDAELRVFDQTVSPALALLQISNRQRQIHDYKTGTKKEILVEGDAASLLKILRTASNANYKPGINVFDAKEFSGNSENIPSSDFYHIITMQGQDIREEYVTQLAVGMTKDSLYYRRMDHDVWGEWKRVILDGDDIGNCVVNGKKLSEWLK